MVYLVETAQHINTSHEEVYIVGGFYHIDDAVFEAARLGFLDGYPLSNTVIQYEKTTGEWLTITEINVQ